MSRIILTPGPVALSPEIKAILSEQAIHHRSSEFKQIFLNVLEKLPKFFGTKNPVMLQTSAGTGAMESSLVNTLSPGDKVLAINSGKFGKRWCEIANSLDLVTTELKVPWGESFDLDNVLDKLDGKKAILTQFSETSTGALHPIKELAAYTKNKDILLIVDTISTLGAIEFKMETLGVDVAFASSHKSFMSPPGITAISLSNKAWEFYKKSKFKKYYFDVKSELKKNKTGQTRFTSSTSVIRSINWALDNIDIYESIKRVNKISKAVGLISELGFKIFPKNPSPSLTVALLPEGQSKLKEKLEDYKIYVADGQDELKGKVIRIGHIGFIRNQDIISLLEALSDILNYDKKEQILIKAKNILEQQ